MVQYWSLHMGRGRLDGLCSREGMTHDLFLKRNKTFLRHGALIFALHSALVMRLGKLVFIFLSFITIRIH